MILHFYFARRFLAAFATVGAVFLAILVLMGLIEQLRRFGGQGLDLAELLGLTLLAAPETLYVILPLIVILATLTMFLSLARSSELVAARAAGRSALRSLYAPLAVALALGGLAVTVFNPIVAATSKQYELRVERLSNGASSVMSLSPEGLWLRQGSDSTTGNAAAQTVIRAARANLDGTQFDDVTFFGFLPGGGPAYRIEAARARLEDGAWALEDAREWRFDSPNPEQGVRRFDTLDLPSTLTRNQILDSFSTPSAIPIWDLPGFIDQLEAAGFSARQHRVWLQMELATPLLLAAMVLVAAVFTMGHTRAARTGVMVLMALAMGFSLFFVRNFAQILGETGQIPIALAAWGPPVAAILLPLGLLLHWEDG